MKYFLYALSGIAVIFIIAFFLINKDRSLTGLQEKNNIKIGYAFEAPYAFVDKNGNVTGLSPTVVQHIVKKLGINNIEWRLVEFSSLIDELESGKIDVIATGMFINSERSKRVNFSEPIFYVEEGLLVVKDNPNKIASLEQALLNDDIQIAVLAGSVEHTLLKEMGFKNDQLLIVHDSHSGVVVLKSGFADALALSLPTLNWILLEDEDGVFEIIKPKLLNEISEKKKNGYGAVQFRKKDVALQNAWNREIKSFIGSSEYIDILKEFGFTEENMPGKMSTDEILNQ